MPAALAGSPCAHILSCHPCLHHSLAGCLVALLVELRSEAGSLVLQPLQLRLVVLAQDVQGSILGGGACGEVSVGAAHTEQCVVVPWAWLCVVGCSVELS